MSLLALSSMRKPTRTTAWSSTSMRRIVVMLPSASVQRQGCAHAHAAAVRILDVDLAAEHARAFAHAADPEMARTIPVRRQSVAMVADFQRQCHCIGDDADID